MTEETQPTWEKRTCKMIKLSEMKTGQDLVGRFSHIRKMTLTDKSTGEVKEVPEYVLTNEKNEKFSFLGDAGFSTEFQKADIEAGNLMKVVKGEQIALNNGKRVNSYDIYVAQ